MATTTKQQNPKPKAPKAEEGQGPAGKARLPLKLILMAVGGRGRARRRRRRRLSFIITRRERGGRGGGPPAKAPVFLDMPDVLVNLSSTGSDARNISKSRLRWNCRTRRGGADPAGHAAASGPFQTYLRELRPTDLDGSAGLYRLKEELTRRVNAAIAPSRINAVLFKEIVIQ